MKKKLTVLVLALITCFGCKDEKAKSSSANLTAASSITKQIKIPKSTALKMKGGFTKTKDTLASVGIVVPDYYSMTLNGLENILWMDGENGEDDLYDEIKLNFVQYLTTDSLSYPELNRFDKSIYIIFSRVKKGIELPKYFAVFSLNKVIEIAPEDFRKMKKNYEQNIKPIINNRVNNPTGGNTDFIRIARNELSDHYGKIKIYDTKIPDAGKKVKAINICFAEALNLKIEKDFKTSQALQLLDKKNYLENQLTVVFDVESTDSKILDNLSSYDMNTLSPPNR